MMLRPSHSGSSWVMWADPGVKPSRIARAQKPLSIAPARDRPWPVSAFRSDDVEALALGIELGDVGGPGCKAVAHRQGAEAALHRAGQGQAVARQRLQI